MDILVTSDSIGVFDCLAGCKLFLLLDGHGSQFELLLLRYVLNKVHEWVVCIGVPYRTSLWKGIDSSDQNRTFNMVLSVGKQVLVEKKQNKMMKPTIHPYDIIMLINHEWS